jgi:hypothetical protein
VYEDVFSKEEIISDSYKIDFVFDGVGGEVQSRFIMRGGENIDIGMSSVIIEE